MLWHEAEAGVAKPGSAAFRRGKLFMENTVLPPLTVDETAEALKTTSHVVRQLIRRGELEAFRMGKLIRIRPHSLTRLINGSTGELAPKVGPLS
jgi:excisionase family DNA binding protein